MFRRGSSAKGEQNEQYRSYITAPGTTEQTKSKRARKANTKVQSKKETKPAKKQAKAKGTASTKAKPAAKSRKGSKKAIILELLRRKEGATLAEIGKATNWQNHSIRGFISGTLSKKMRFTVESVKSDKG